MSAPAPPPPPGTNAPPPVKSRTGRTVAIVAVVVVAVLVLGLIVSGIIPLPSGGSTSSGTSTAPYSVATSSAASVAGAALGGPWSMFAAEGIDSISGYSNSTPVAGCTFTGGTGTLSLPAYTGNYSDGQLATWLFVFVNSNRTSELAVEFSGGHASEIGVLTQSDSCYLELRGARSLPGTVVDSPQIASSLLKSPQVAAFLRNYTFANADFFLYPAGPQSTAWSVEYSGCALSGYGSGPIDGVTVSAEFNATSGAMVGSVDSSPSNTPCPSSSAGTPIGSAFAAGNPAASTCAPGGTVATTGCTAGDYIFTLTVESSTVPFGSVLFEVRMADNLIFINTGSAAFAIRTLSGNVAAYSTLAAGAGLAMASPWSNYEGSTTASTVLANIYSIVIDTGQATSTVGLNDLDFVAVGTGSYSGMTPPLVLPASGSPIGTVFAVGNPILSTCVSGGTFATTGCNGGDEIYTLTVESSAVTFGSVLFEVMTATGSIFSNTGTGGFAILNLTGVPAAYSTLPAGAGLAMVTTWSTYEATNTASTPLTSIYAITVDMGQSTSTAGEGLSFVVLGIGEYSGSASLALP